MGYILEFLDNAAKCPLALAHSTPIANMHHHVAGASDSNVQAVRGTDEAGRNLVAVAEEYDVRFVLLEGVYGTHAERHELRTILEHAQANGLQFLGLFLVERKDRDRPLFDLPTFLVLLGLCLREIAELF